MRLSNLSGRSCHLDLTPNSQNKFTRGCEAAREGGGEELTNKILRVRELNSD